MAGYAPVGTPAATAPPGSIMMAPPTITLGAAPAVPVMAAAPTYANGMHFLSSTPGLFVKEQINLVEVFTGCEMQNNYKGYVWYPEMGATNAKAGKGPEAFEMREQSDFCQRQCCGPMRAFKIAIVPASPTMATYIPGVSRDTIFSHPDAMVIDRPFRCTCLCWNRPKAYMSHAQMGRFATITNPFRLCAFEFDIDAASAEDGGIGPVAREVTNPGEKLYKVYEGSDAGMTTPVGEVARVFPGCCQSMYTEADDFTLSFPPASDPLRRASLISAVMMMNYLFYERNKNNNNHG